mgnify:CR=1 FL=1
METMTNREKEEIIVKKLCPICRRKLIRKKEGYVCKNWKCLLYWKLNVGWVYHEKV